MPIFLKHNQKTKGFTLIETVIYIALFTIIMSLILTAFFQIFGSYNQNKGRIEIEGEANFIMQKIIWAMSGAQTINSPALNATSSTLSINKFNYASNPIVFSLSSSTAMLSRGGSMALPISNNIVKISKLEFEHLPAQGDVPEGVKITLSVSATTSMVLMGSTTLKNIIYLRK